MTAFREMLALLRLAQATLSARYYRWDLDRARRGLELAIAAQDRAIADLRTIEYVEREQDPARREPPALVRKADDAGAIEREQAAKVRPIRKRRAAAVAQS